MPKYTATVQYGRVFRSCMTVTVNAEDETEAREKAEKAAKRRANPQIISIKEECKNT